MCLFHSNYTNKFALPEGHMAEVLGYVCGSRAVDQAPVQRNTGGKVE